MAFQAVLFQGDYQFLHGDLMSFVPSGLVGITIADGEHVADLGRIQSVGISLRIIWHGAGRACVSLNIEI
jgi:hypothetical protein